MSGVSPSRPERNNERWLGVELRLALASVCTIAFCFFSACSNTQANTAAAAAKSGTIAPSAAESEPLRGMLARWNWYRVSVGVPPLGTDDELCRGAELHSKYLIENQLKGADAFIENGRMKNVDMYPGVRTEGAGNPGYSRASERAANAGYIIRAKSIPADGSSIVDMMMAMGFNELPMLNPQLAAIGYGSFCENDDCVITISFKQGLSESQLASLYRVSYFKKATASSIGPFLRARLRRPIFFPPENGTTTIASFDGKAQPNAQTGCGWSGESGPVILLSLGAPKQGIEVKLASYSFSEKGTKLESCAFDETNYKNPNGYLQRMGRIYLNWGGAVMLIPRDPLKPGHTYSVSITADNQPYPWSFTVAPDAK